jgi:hypothetical protein
MNIHDLYRLVDVFEYSRGFGHTTLGVEGLMNQREKFFVLVTEMTEYENIRRKLPNPSLCYPLPINRLDTILGRTYPIYIDLHVMKKILLFIFQNQDLLVNNPEIEESKLEFIKTIKSQLLENTKVLSNSKKITTNKRRINKIANMSLYDRIFNFKRKVFEM